MKLVLEKVYLNKNSREALICKNGRYNYHLYHIASNGFTTPRWEHKAEIDLDEHDYILKEIEEGSWEEVKIKDLKDKEMKKEILKVL